MADGVLRYLERRLSVELRSTSRRTTLPGPDALRVLDERKPHWTLSAAHDAYIRSLLSRSDAIAVVIDFPEDPGLPTGIIFIPWPAAATFAPPPDDDDSPGAFLMFGTLTHRPDVARGEYPKLTARPNWDTLSASTFESLRSRRSTFVVIIHAEGCPGSAGGFASLATAIQEAEVPPPVFVDDHGSITGSLVRAQLGLVSFPTLIFFAHGALADIQVGAHQVEPVAAAKHFLWRNGVEVRDPGLASDFRDLAATEGGLRTLAQLRHLPAANLDGADLSGLRLRRGSLSGSSLRGARLRDADLREAILTHANLTGADLTGVQVDGALWKSTICPDGRNTDDIGGSCPLPK